SGPTGQLGIVSTLQTRQARPITDVVIAVFDHFFRDRSHRSDQGLTEVAGGTQGAFFGYFDGTFDVLVAGFHACGDVVRSQSNCLDERFVTRRPDLFDVRCDLDIEQFGELRS